MRIHRKIRIGLGLCLLLCLMAAGIFNGGQQTGQADASAVTTASLRLIFTTDLHGQLGTYDYQSGKKYNKGSLAKAFTLIREARTEAGKKNTMTFDIGDVLYDFSTDQIFRADQNEIQPIYKAMKLVGYDAITIGNHDFDYGLEYLKKQYEGAGLSDLVISSNVKNAVTRESEWTERKIITKTIKDHNGKNVDVRVGILGVVLPKLSSKTEDYTGVLISEDIVQNVTREAKLLKEEGADLVIVLSHSGMGEETPVEEAKNASYALTKIPQVDVVLCGHEHNAYPSTLEAAKPYYELKGNDPKTGLMNGKVILMSKDRGQSIGVADLELSFDKDGAVTIRDTKEEIRFVTADTPAVKKLDGKNGMGDWNAKLKKIAKQDETLVTLAEGTSVNNFFGMLEDCSAMQLLNDSKISFCTTYLQSNYGDKYDGYPIVAASRYVSYGEIDGTDYVNLQDQIRETDLTQLATYNKYVDIYKVTGAQLREWMEWSASAYLQTGKTAKFTDSIMNHLLDANAYQSLLLAKGLNYWSYFYQFDGVEYTIDPSQEARYDISGLKVSDSHRVVTLTHNGAQVHDTDEFILITDRQSQLKEATAGFDKQRLVRVKYVSVQNILEDYLKKLNTGALVTIEADHNWTVLYDPSQTYLVKSGEDSYPESQKLGLSRVAYQNYYNYYKGSLAQLYTGENAKDQYGPGLVLSSTNEEQTSRNVTVRVQATDRSGIRRILYYKGELEKDDGMWSYIANQSDYVISNSFTVNENGVYTVMAEDFMGNRSIKRIRISNINAKILQKPKVKKYYNRSKKIRGTADPLVTVMIEADGVRYQTQTGADGSFRCELPYQNAKTQLKVWVTDEDGRTSKETIVTVLRSGPNLPSFSRIENRDEQITGVVNDSDVTVVAIVNGSKVYVADRAAKELWKSSAKYDSKKKIVYTKVSVKENGKFTMNIPVLKGNTKVNLYTMDAIGRLSRITKKKVAAVAPNQPRLFDVTDAEKYVYGYVPGCKAYKGTTYDIIVRIGSEKYEGISDAEGNFAVEIYEPPKAGKTISVCARAADSSGVKMESAHYDAVVQSAGSLAKESFRIEIDDMTDKEDVITGTSEYGEELFRICYKNKNYEVVTDENGDYQLDLTRGIEAGTPVYVISRYEDGELDRIVMTYVKKGRAQKPVIFEDEVTNNTKRLRIATDERCELVVCYGDQKIVTTDCEYDELLGEYMYTVKIPRNPSGTEFTVYARNSAGNSKKTRFTLTELSPDTPKLTAEITEKTKKITGKVHIVAPQEDPEETPTVASTGTRVIFKIRQKEYEAVVKKDGSFYLTVTKKMELKEGLKMTYWGENDAGGAGIKGTLVVKKAKK